MSACVIRKIGPLQFKAPAGTVALKLDSTVGTVTFDCTQTKVSDSAGASVPSNCSATKLSFKGTSGTTYKVDVLYVFSDPLNDKGVLREDCDSNNDLDNVDRLGLNPTYTFVVQ